MFWQAFKNYIVDLLCICRAKMHAMGFLIFVGCCNTKRLQDLKWPDEYFMTTQRLAQRDTPAGARKTCKSNPLTLLKSLKKDASRLVSNKFRNIASFCLSILFAFTSEKINLGIHQQTPWGFYMHMVVDVHGFHRWLLIEVPFFGHPFFFAKICC